MKKLLCFAILLAVSGCSERLQSNRALRKIKTAHEKIQKLLAEYPTLVDSVSIVKRDTLFITKPAVTVAANNDVDTWDFEMLANVDSTAHALTVATDKRPPAKRLQQKICPRINKDTTIYVRVKNSVLDYRVPVNFSVVAAGGKITVQTNAVDLHIPENTPLPEAVFKAPQRPLLSNLWFWVAVVSWVVTVLIVLTVLRTIGIQRPR